jgi:hypothetical protein
MPLRCPLLVNTQTDARLTQLYPLSAYLGFPQRAHTKPMQHHVHFFSRARRRAWNRWAQILLESRMLCLKCVVSQEPRFV